MRWLQITGQEKNTTLLGLMHRNPHHHMRDLRLKAIPVVYGFQFNVLFLTSAIITFGNTGILRGFKISQLNGVVLALLIFWCIFIITSPERLDYQYREITQKITKKGYFEHIVTTYILAQCTLLQSPL